MQFISHGFRWKLASGHLRRVFVTLPLKVMAFGAPFFSKCFL